MDTAEPEIQFDGEGCCNYCVEFLKGRAGELVRVGQESVGGLERLIARIKEAGRTKAYDCVVGLSGGLDSSYAAYVAKTHGLRLLGVHMDNGWNSDVAVKNIKHLAEKLGIDYASYVLNWEEFKDLQLAFFKASVPEIETPTDIAIPAALHKVAAQHGIKFILSGGNNATEGIRPRGWHYDAKDVKYLRAIHHEFGTRPIASLPMFGYWQEAYFKFREGIRFVYLLNRVHYSRNEAKDYLTRELGWADYGGKHHESKITAFVHSYVLPTKFNIDYRRATLSTEICVGTITRAEALAILKQPSFDPNTIDADKDYVAKKFGISRAELDRLLALPPKSHKDYPNNQRFLETLYSVYRKASALPFFRT
jgi:N-acetyl sugar amidotransferase